MKFICNLNILKTAASNVFLSIGSKNTTMPILEGMLINCTEKEIILTGYDLSLGITKKIEENQIINTGAIVLKAQLFVEILKKLEGETIEISTNEKFIATIKSENTKYTLTGIDPIQYPQIPTIEETPENTFLIPDKTLKNSIFQILFAASTNTTQNQILCGILFEIEKDKLKLVAVDGFRVAIKYCKIKNSNIKTNLVVGNKTMLEISKLLLEEENKFTKITVGNNHIVFKTNDYIIIGRLLDGSFIDYKTAIPIKCATEIFLDPKIFELSLKKVSVMVTQNISINLKITKNIGHLNCESPLGTANDSFELNLKGTELENIAFNSKFMLDALNHCVCKTVRIGFNGPIMPIIIESETNSDFTYLVLPVRVK